jgi:hypothetical protein
MSRFSRPIFATKTTPGAGMQRRLVFGLWLAGISWCFVVVGCTAPGPAAIAAPAEAPRAHLTVVNLSAYEWRIAINHQAGGEAYAMRLAPRGSVTVDLPGGDYVIDQTALSADASPELNRRVPARLESGQAYRWRLLTVLSGSESGDAAR